MEEKKSPTEQTYIPVEWRDKYTLVISGEENKHRIVATNLDGPSQEKVEELLGAIILITPLITPLTG